MKIHSSHMLWLPFLFACTQEGTDVQKFNLAPSVSIQSPEEGSYLMRERRLFLRQLSVTTQMTLNF